MILKFAFAGVAIVLMGTACSSLHMTDPGPIRTATEDVDGGNAEVVRTEIHMGAGDLRLEGGTGKLLSASFRYSEALGRPVVHYAPGKLTVDSPKDSSVSGQMVNEWNLRMGSQAPVDASVTVGAGKADLDLSKLPLRGLEVHMGAGELLLNLTGKYSKDVTVQVSSGVGEAKIRLPKGMGAVVDAKAGLGGVSAKGFSQRDGKYYNDAYAEGKPAIRVDVRGGVGEVTLTLED